jgi:hypothetical protein
MVTPPYAGNPNLRAQEGVFTIPAKNILDNPDGAADRYNLSDIIAKSLKPAGLIKFTLPASQALRVLKLLAKHNVTAASLFPGYAGVVKAMIEQETTERSPIGDMEVSRPFR